MPLRILANRSRSGSYLIMLVLATAMFGLFFFLTIFVQDVLGYSALKAGVAFLPLAGTIVVVSGIASQLISRTGARPLMLAGAAAPPAACTGSPTSACTPPTWPGCSARAWSPARAWECCSCRCHWWCSPVSATRTPGWSPACSTPASRSAARSAWPRLAPWPGPRWPTAPAARAMHAAAASRSGHVQPSAQVPASIYHNALAAGISRGLLTASAIALAALIIAAVTIRVRREDLAGTPEPAQDQPPAPSRRSSRPVRNSSGSPTVTRHRRRAMSAWPSGTAGQARGRFPHRGITRRFPRKRPTQLRETFRGDARTSDPARTAPCRAPCAQLHRRAGDGAASARHSRLIEAASWALDLDLSLLGGALGALDLVDHVPRVHLTLLRIPLGLR